MTKPKSKYSPAAQETIEEKMHKLAKEDKPLAQKIAIAISMARQKGQKVPTRQGQKVD